MHPAFSVIFLTTLIGAGQGLFLALYAGELAVMKTVGYSRGLLAALTSAAAMVLAAVGGAAGLIGAKAFTLLVDPTGGMLPVFYLSPAELGLGMALALAVGVVS
ncbi:MAG: hypothetical protein HGA75_18985, partial [Thiobacillus sp.]|nr:hypothetical protein [Thiobacillus sp.]